METPLYKLKFLYLLYHIHISFYILQSFLCFYYINKTKFHKLINEQKTLINVYFVHLLIYERNKIIRAMPKTKKRRVKKVANRRKQKKKKKNTELATARILLLIEILSIVNTILDKFSFIIPQCTMNDTNKLVKISIALAIVNIVLQIFL